MTTHELARYLLSSAPDLPVVINGWGSDEGFSYEVTKATWSHDQVLLDYEGEALAWTTWHEPVELPVLNIDDPRPWKEKE